MTIPTPGTNNFASAFNKDETSEGGGEEEETSLVLFVSKMFQNSPFARKKLQTRASLRR